MKTIGFFGDSYCSDLTSKVGDHSWGTDWKTYIELLSENENLQIKNLGYLGSSIWDCILLQFNNYISSNTIPDVCIFCWTEPSRLFYRDFRRISIASLRFDTIEDKELKKAVEYYYKYFYDDELHNFQRISAFYYFDNVVLSKYKHKTKFIHLASNAPLDYEFTNGLTFLQPLYFFYKNKQTRKQIGCSNHIFGEKNNLHLYTKISNAIATYNEEPKLRKL